MRTSGEERLDPDLSDLTEFLIENRDHPDLSVQFLADGLGWSDVRVKRRLRELGDQGIVNSALRLGFGRGDVSARIAQLVGDYTDVDWPLT